MSLLPSRAASPRLLVLAALFHGAALSPAWAQLDPTPLSILPDLRFAAPVDLNGDGRDEIVGVSYASRALVAYTLNGDGNAIFDRSLANLGSTGTDLDGRWTLRLFDLDGDGRDDLVQADLQSVYVFYDRGGPQFEERVVVQSIHELKDFAPIDLDADGDVDLLTFLPAGSSSNGSGIRWIENLGGGSFAAAVPLATGATDYTQLIPLDIDGDGDLDFAGLQAGPIPVVVRNLGGAFQVEPLAGNTFNAVAVEVGDVDDDDNIDFLLLRQFGQTSVVDLYRGGPGGFQAPVVVLDSPNRLIADLTLANIDGIDGDELICRVDLPGTDQSIRIFERGSQGTFFGLVDEVAVPPSLVPVGVFQTAEFDGDGKEDLMIRWGSGPQILRGDTDAGAPALGEPLGLVESSMSPPYFAGDLDGDGVTDLLRSRPAGLQWQRGRPGSVQFDLPARISDPATVELVADLNGDGLPEIFLSDDGTGIAVSLSVVQSLGAGSFSAPALVTPALPEWRSGSYITTCDHDQDGDLDLFFPRALPGLFWMENLGGLLFAPPAPVGITTTTAYTVLYPVDFDGDGIGDLFEAAYDFGFLTQYGWFQGLGGGAFAARQDLGLQANDYRVAALDVNEDSIDDVVYSFANETLALLGGPGGPGAGGAPVRLFGSIFGAPVELLDVNDDGLTDLVDNELAFLRTGPLAFDPAPIPLAPSPVRLFDFGGDGDLDGLGRVDDIDVIFEGLSRGKSGTSYCGPAVPNSSGLPASLFALGTNEVQQGELRLRVSDAGLNTFGFFLVSPVSQPATAVVGSVGRLCLGGAIGRYVAPGQVQSTGLTGSFQLDLDLSAIPTPLGPVAAMPGATWFFQAWFRDLATSGATSNFTDGVEVTFR